jgi:hypothetical protein
MPARIRDDFSKPDIQVLGERAGYICSNSDCRQPTIGPHSDPGKSLKTGKACHINAAAEGGPRYDATQSPEERSNIANGIWLCSVCSDLVDKDQVRHPANVLFEWRHSHEDWIRAGGIVPKLPALSLTTLNGFTLPDSPGTVQLSDLKDIREHTFCISNVSETELLMIDARVQLAEPVLKSAGRYKPVGVNVSWEAIIPQMVVTGSGGGGVTRNRGPSPTHLYQLQIDKLPPASVLKLEYLRRSSRGRIRIFLTTLVCGLALTSRQPLCSLSMARRNMSTKGLDSREGFLHL